MIGHSGLVPCIRRSLSDAGSAMAEPRPMFDIELPPSTNTRDQTNSPGRETPRMVEPPREVHRILPPPFSVGLASREMGWRHASHMALVVLDPAGADSLFYAALFAIC